LPFETRKATHTPLSSSSDTSLGGIDVDATIASPRSEFANTHGREKHVPGDDAAHAGCPVPPPRTTNSARIGNWLEKHRGLSREASLPSARHIDVIFLGDSITEHWGTKGRHGELQDRTADPEAAWTALNRRLGGRAMALGISSDETQDLHWRLLNGELPLTLQPKVIALLVGINDLINCVARIEPRPLHLQTSTRPSDEVSTFAGNRAQGDTCVSAMVGRYRCLLEYLHAARPNASILVHGLFPTHLNVYAMEKRGAKKAKTDLLASLRRHPDRNLSGDDPDLVGHANRAIREMVSADSCARGGSTCARTFGRTVYLYCGGVFCRRLRPHGATPLRPGANRGNGERLHSLNAITMEPKGDGLHTCVPDAELMPDLLHPTNTGRKLWAACVLPAIEAELEALRRRQSNLTM